MKTKWTLVAMAAAVLAAGVGGCSMLQSGTAEREAAGEDAGEVKIPLEQAPAAVQKTIKREAEGGELEDIARKQKNGRTVYETDIVKDGQEWEVNVAEDGSLISRIREGKEDDRDDKNAKDDKEDVEEAEKAQDAAAAAAKDGWRDTFDVGKAALKPTGENEYLPVKPGKVLTLRHGEDTLTLTVLPGTKTVDGVECGILEERETKRGKLAEVSYNYVACDPSTQDVYYFGEDVDNYKDGKVVNHDSAWLAGRKGARFGLLVPGRPQVGQKFYQEVAPKEAMDRVEVVSTDATVKTPAGTFEHCVEFRETTPLERDVSRKWFAPGVGMVKDDGFELAEKPE